MLRVAVSSTSDTVLDGLGEADDYPGLGVLLVFGTVAFGSGPPGAAK